MVVKMATNSLLNLKQAEEMRIDNEERFHRFFIAAFEGIIISDQGKIIDANEQFAKMFGYELQEVIGMEVKNLVSPEDSDFVLEDTRLEDEKPYEHSAICKDGSTLFVEVRCRAIPYKGRVVRAMAIRDITDRRLLLREIIDLNVELEKRVQERTLQLELANRKLREANRAKSKFLSAMSHELRTPLNAIIGFSEVLRDGLCGDLNQDQQDAVTDIYESGKHLLSMINDILDLSKVEAGKIELQYEMFQIEEMLESVRTVVSGNVSKKGLQYEEHLPPNLPPIYADKVRFKQILYNLVSNAVKFTPEGGSVTIYASHDENEFTFTVDDTGIGIREEDTPKLFNEFVQIESSYARQYEGTGLGLALSKGLVEKHGGRIWVESEYGKGSKFIFTIPNLSGRKEEYLEI